MTVILAINLCKGFYLSTSLFVALCQAKQSLGFFMAEEVSHDVMDIKLDQQTITSDLDSYRVSNTSGLM